MAAAVAASAFIVLAAVSYGIVTADISIRSQQCHQGRARRRWPRVRILHRHHRIFRQQASQPRGNPARAGVTGMSSLLFFDVTDARARLMSDPRVADATLLKLYPDRLQISIVERQRLSRCGRSTGRSVCVAEDGAVLAPYVAQRISRPADVRWHAAPKSAARN